ncbi:30S ribosomal protein S13 [bacterium AB1]|nr:30S ribosomal protein S13 [bacterium AB1]
MSIARVVGYNLKEKKQIYIALTSIYGIGKFLSKKICSSLNIDPYIRVKDLSNVQLHDLNTHISTNYKYGEELKKEIYDNIKMLINIKSYRGNRLSNGLPCRGQRSNTNAKTAKKLAFKPS